MQTHNVTMQTFDDVVEKNEIVLLDFWATWCQPCKILGPVLDEMAKHHTDIYFGKVNTEECKDLAEAFQVKSIPTLMAFKKGELVFEQTGLLPPPKLEELVETLRTLEVQPTPMEEEPV